MHAILLKFVALAASFSSFLSAYTFNLARCLPPRHGCLSALRRLEGALTSSELLLDTLTPSSFFPSVTLCTLASFKQASRQKRRLSESVRLPVSRSCFLFLQISVLYPFSHIITTIATATKPVILPPLLHSLS